MLARRIGASFRWSLPLKLIRTPKARRRKTKSTPSIRSCCWTT